ncbi:MAG: hypothetical protein FWD68_04860 [Alphaproteobacteria bacterium]|nr:hypothetical protein [Alphaproteobacteria bacterium]
MGIEADNHAQRAVRRQGRWAFMMAFFSAFSLLVCAAFADQAERRLGLPGVAIYGMAAIAAVLVVVLHLSAGSAVGGLSLRAYSWTAGMLALVLVALNAYICLFVFVDSSGQTSTLGGRTFVTPPTPLGQVAASVAILAVLCALALFALWRLAAGVRAQRQAG